MHPSNPVLLSGPNTKIIPPGAHIAWAVTDTTRGAVTAAGGTNSYSVSSVVFNTGTAVVLFSVIGNSLTTPTVTIGGSSATVITSGNNSSGGQALIAYLSGVTSGSKTVVISDAGGGATFTQVGFCAGTLTNEVEPITSSTTANGYSYVNNPVTTSAVTVPTSPVHGIALVAVNQATTPNDIAWYASGGSGYVTDMSASGTIISLTAGHFSSSDTPSFDNSGAGAGYMSIAVGTWTSA